MGVGWVGEVGGESSSKRIVDEDSNIVDGGLWVLMEVSVNADSVWELDGWEGGHVFFDVFRDVGDISLLTLENLLELA